MCKFKLLFLFIFGLSIFNATFCMENNGNSGAKKRKFQEISNKESDKQLLEESENQDENNTKKRKVIVSVHLINLKKALEKFEKLFNKDFVDLNLATKDLSIDDYKMVAADIENNNISKKIAEFKKYFKSGDIESVKNSVNKIIDNVYCYILDCNEYLNAIQKKGSTLDQAGNEVPEYEKDYINIHVLADKFLPIMEHYFLCFCDVNNSDKSIETIFDNIVEIRGKMFEGNCDDSESFINFIIKSENIEAEEKLEILEYVLKDLEYEINEVDLIWSDLLTQDVNVIACVILKFETTGDNFFSESSFDSLYVALAKSNRPDLLIIIGLLLNKNINWLKIFDIFYVKNNLEVLLFLQNNVTDKKTGKTLFDYIIENKNNNLFLIHKFILNCKKDETGRNIVPASVKNNADIFVRKIYEISMMFPSANGLKGEDSKSEYLLSNLITFVNDYIFSTIKTFSDQKKIDNIYYLDDDYYVKLYNQLRFIFSIAIDLISDCEKNNVKLCELSKPNNKGRYLIHDVFYCTVGIQNLFVNSYKIKNILTDYIKYMVDFLLKNGSKIDMTCGAGCQPIHYSCRGFDEVEKYYDELDVFNVGKNLYDGLTRYLIENYKADVNARDSKNCTPLYLAVKAGKESSIKALSDNNVSLNNLDGNDTDFYTLLKNSKLATEKGLDKHFEIIKDANEKFEEIKNNALERKEPILKKIFLKESCSFCLDNFTDEAKCVFLVSCGHSICEKCLKKDFVSVGTMVDKEAKKPISCIGKFKPCSDCRSIPTDIEFDSKKLRDYINNYQEELCSICLALLKISEENGEEVELKCKGKHRFHKKCINNWYESGADTCPNCREKIKN